MFMKGNDIREAYLSFFENKGHLRLDSFSLIPKDDPSLLLIGAGMAPLKPYFTGKVEPPCHRITTSQKCIRTGDIENVGRTARHHTFFEMLGNFSFGDYFKKEAITWAWEFLTEVVKLDKERLYVTIYPDDQEAHDYWHKMIGLPENHIYPLADNFWAIGQGPCGPDSEIFYDQGEEFGTDPANQMGGDGDRFLEIWNLVFSQFDQQKDGSFIPLAKKNIDTGAGLERMAAVLQGKKNNFETDLFFPIMEEASRLSHVNYGTSASGDVALKVIADHSRAITNMISDGILPSNEGRGYVLRRLLRRAARHGRKLGIEGKFLAELSKTVIELSKDGYPELEEKQSMIFKVLTEEEDKFNKTIDQGLAILAEMEDAMAAAGEKTLSGENAFKLYDTYGFPVDLTKEILEEKGCTVDEEGFAAAMKEQKDKARKARKTTNYMGADVTVYQSIDAAITSEFVGYDKLDVDSKISVLTTEDEIVEALTDGQRGTIIADQTTFYGTMGGQQGDKGTIHSANGEFKVEETIHLQGGKIGHVGVMTKGMLSIGETVTLSVCPKNRALTSKNHSATHLLQKALRTVLGSHVEQAGSYVDAGRLRFDFTHFSAMTPEEIKKVEDIVNEEIQAALPVVTEVMTLDEAKKTGAMALFGEKYGEKVRVVKMGDFSTELCGGTHVANTSTIGYFKIFSEAGIAAGVRRIEALTSDGLMKHYAEVEAELHEAAKAAKTTPAALTAKIQSLLDEIKALNSENEKLKSKMANDSLGDVLSQVKEVNGVKVLASKVADVDMNGLRNLGDQLKDKIGEGVVVIASVMDGKVSLMATVTDEAQKKGAHAGNLIKAIAGLVGGGGGGRPNMAQAGGKNPAGIEEALKKAVEVVEEQTK